MKTNAILVALCASGLIAAAGDAFADKPSWAASGKKDKHEMQNDNCRGLIFSDTSIGGEST